MALLAKCNTALTLLSLQSHIRRNQRPVPARSTTDVSQIAWTFPSLKIADGGDECGRRGNLHSLWGRRKISTNRIKKSFKF